MPSETPETDIEESHQTQRFGCRMVKSDFARKLELRHRAIMRELADIEDLSRNMTTTRQTLRDRLGALLRSNAEVSEGGTRDSRIETAAQSRPSLH